MEHHVSIIVFSKGRPMQLHAYLESLLLFSDARQEDITVLCCETEGIHYEKVMDRFAQVHWHIEKKLTKKKRSPSVKQIVIITVTGN